MCSTMIDDAMKVIQTLHGKDRRSETHCRAHLLLEGYRCSVISFFPNADTTVKACTHRFSGYTFVTLDRDFKNLLATCNQLNKMLEAVST